jgi:hypothetical protein
VTIRAKLYVAIALSVVGPVVTVAVALFGMSQMGDRFDDVQARSASRALALQLKFGVTDVNGWQTAYGYDDGASRPEFDRSVQRFRADLVTARRMLTGPRERELLARLDDRFAEFMRLDAVAYRALRAGRPARTRQILLGPEITNFRALAATAEQLATTEATAAKAAEADFDDQRRRSRRQMIATALGAGLVIVLLLVTANDIARMALEGVRRREDEVDPGAADDADEPPA